MDTSAIAGKVASVDEMLMRLFPTITMITGMIPGGQGPAAAMAASSPLIIRLLTAIDNAAKHVQAGNPELAAEDVVGEIENHMKPGGKLSSALI